METVDFLVKFLSKGQSGGGGTAGAGDAASGAASNAASTGDFASIFLLIAALLSVAVAFCYAYHKKCQVTSAIDSHNGAGINDFSKSIFASNKILFVVVGVIAAICVACACGFGGVKNAIADTASKLFQATNVEYSYSTDKAAWVNTSSCISNQSESDASVVNLHIEKMADADDKGISWKIGEAGSQNYWYSGIIDQSVDASIPGASINARDSIYVSVESDEFTTEIADLLAEKDLFKVSLDIQQNLSNEAYAYRQDENGESVMHFAYDANRSTRSETYNLNSFVQEPEGFQDIVPGWFHEDEKSKTGYSPAQFNRISVDDSFVNYPVQTMAAWFDMQTNFRVSDDFKKLNVSQCKDFNYLFAMSNIDYFNANVFKDTPNLSRVGAMFLSCENLKSVDLSSLNTQSLKDEEGKDANAVISLFGYCSSLEQLELGNFNTSNVRSMLGMFTNCTSLKNLDISKFDTKNVESYFCMFSSCVGLEELFLSNFDTTKAVDMTGMFQTCVSLKNLDLSNFTTNNVENMSYMFYGCEQLKSLNIKNFSVESVLEAVKISHMFEGDKLLETIICDNDWTSSTKAEIKAVSLFVDCVCLKGGQGTKYINQPEDEKDTGKFAKSDQGFVSPGYFTNS